MAFITVVMNLEVSFERLEKLCLLEYRLVTGALVVYQRRDFFKRTGNSSEHG